MKPFLGSWHRLLSLQDMCWEAQNVVFQVEVKGGGEEPPGKLDSPILPVLLAPTQSLWSWLAACQNS